MTAGSKKAALPGGPSLNLYGDAINSGLRPASQALAMKPTGNGDAKPPTPQLIPPAAPELRGPCTSV
jgi:hypothetical protein